MFLIKKVLGVRKERRLQENKGGLFFMTKYEYLVFTEYEELLVFKLDDYGKYGWKLVNVIWNNDGLRLIVTMMREIDY